MGDCVTSILITTGLMGGESLSHDRGAKKIRLVQEKFVLKSIVEKHIDTRFPLSLWRTAQYIASVYRF